MDRYVVCGPPSFHLSVLPCCLIILLRLCLGFLAWFPDHPSFDLSGVNLFLCIYGFYSTPSDLVSTHVLDISTAGMCFIFVEIMLTNLAFLGEIQV